MSTDFSIKPVGAPVATPIVHPVSEAAHKAVTTELPAAQSVTAADASARARIDPETASPYVSHQVILDQAVEKRSRAVRAAKIHSGTRPEDDVVLDYPTPCGALGRYGDDVLSTIMVDNCQPLEGDVMHRPTGALGLDAVNWKVHAIDS